MTGPLLTSYSLPKLKEQIQFECPVLPIVSLGTPADLIEDMGPLVLPPLYHEAMTAEVKSSLLERIRPLLSLLLGKRSTQVSGN